MGKQLTGDLVKNPKVVTIFLADFRVAQALAAVIAKADHEGTWEIHTIMQAEYVLGKRSEKKLGQLLPKWPIDE